MKREAEEAAKINGGKYASPVGDAGGAPISRRSARHEQISSIQKIIFGTVVVFAIGLVSGFALGYAVRAAISFDIGKLQ